jgi:uncharacterized membrane protein
MKLAAAVTIFKPEEEVQRLWRISELHPTYIEEAQAAVTFKRAPGDRGTEIHVNLEHRTPAGKLGEIVEQLTGSAPLPKVKDDLRRFKQRVETGEVPRSDGTPEGESAERKIKQRPAQPLPDSELQKVGV